MMKNTRLFPIISVLAPFALILTILDSCKKKDDVDCSTVTGATFTSNSGVIASILESKCSTANCHKAGGAGSAHWEWVANYDTVQQHFEHMLEAVEKGEMPEAGSTQLTTEEKNQLICWKNSGYPE